MNLRYAKSKNLTPYDVLIIASMIEKETVAPEERKLVGAVIYNRLRNRMPLGIDATIRYGRNVPGTEPLKKSDIESDNPYNTRKRLGLPPTPISNPGLASMKAAARPASVDYLYFVRKPDGVHHFFTASESEFCAEVARVRVRRLLNARKLAPCTGNRTGEGTDHACRTCASRGYRRACRTERRLHCGAHGDDGLLPAPRPVRDLAAACVRRALRGRAPHRGGTDVDCVRDRRRMSVQGSVDLPSEEVPGRA